MAIAKPNITTHDVVPQSIPDAYDTITVSDRVTPLDIQVTCTEGSPWPVTYYNQRLGADNEQRYSDTELSPSFQSYTRIKNMILRVTTPVDNVVVDGINEATGVSIVTGITPAVGDVLVGAVLGVYYVFNVVAVTPLSFLATTSYSIEYQMVCTAERESARVKDLYTKTYETLVWDATLGCGSLLKEEVVEVRAELHDMLVKIMDAYLRLFLDADTDLIILEDDYKIYDEALTQFILHTWPLERTILGKRLRGVAPIISIKEHYTLWDEMVDQSSILFNLTTTLGFTSSNNYAPTRTAIGHIKHRVDWLVEPDGATPLSTVYPSETIAPPESTYADVISPVYSPVHTTYVFSTAYYNDTPTSVLERMVHAYLNKQPIPEADVLSVAHTWKRWSAVNAYWQTPVLILLIRYVLEGAA